MTGFFYGGSQLINMEPIILLYTCLPLWALAVVMYARRFREYKNNWLSWIALLFIFVPILFFPLCAYNEKVIAKENGLDRMILKQEFRLRIWICLSCYISELFLGFLLKHIGIDYYAELAVSCMNISQFILIISCWNLFRAIRRP